MQHRPFLAKVRQHGDRGDPTRMTDQVRLHVLDLGRLRMDRHLLVADAAAGEAVEIPVAAYVIAHPDGAVLFDTGCHPQAMGAGGLWPTDYQRNFPWSGGEACHLPNRLAALGLRPRDFAAVVLSHLHNDHAGCVEFFAGVPLIVHRDELAAALAAHDAGDDSNYVGAETARWRALDLAWRPIDADVPLNDAVTVLNLGRGHCAGLLGLHVRLPETGDIILASDALYCAANFAPAFRPPGLLLDAAGWDATARYIAARADRTSAQVWFGHDAAQFATLRQKPEGFFA
jgi:glyoxylase-like metal-dependent hydrolase (beta-lactamase superfamily II)